MVGTSGTHPPETFSTESPYTRLERFISHDAILARSAVVVCHGGMGISQRALARGLPVVVVPFGRDQLEVARRVEQAGAGVRLAPKRLNASTLASAVSVAQALESGARRVAQAFSDAGGDGAAADTVEALLAEKSTTAPQAVI